ncbi:MAG: radical SAM protein [Candidatus Omnitrophota bacterium]|nr:radical SAM protein [Candidatus Omnitrophota bacterium]
MLDYNEVRISQILNPTAIDLGEYVINPFMGCEFACLYCYVRSNRVVSKKNKPWGEYVDIRVNAPELLEKEILKKKPKQVLLGSTTECFQPVERKHRITRKILQVLNSYKVNYVILTRSPHILDYLDLLKEGLCKKIYFTVNNFSKAFKYNLEPKSPEFRLREEAVRIMLKENIDVVPYFSPLLPWISDIEDVFGKFEQAAQVEFESLNFNLNNISAIINCIGQVEPLLGLRYERMLKDKEFYQEICERLKTDIAAKAKQAGREYRLYTHNFRDYFKNSYG